VLDYNSTDKITYIYTASTDKTSHRIGNTTSVIAYVGHTKAVNDVAVVGWFVYTACEDFGIRKFSMFNSTAVSLFNNTVRPVTMFSLGQTLIVGNADGSINYLNVTANTTLMDSFVAHESSITAMILSNDKTMLFTAGLDQYVKQWDLATKTLIRTFPVVHTKRINALLEYNGFLFSGGSDNLCYQYRISTGAIFYTYDDVEAINSIIVDENYIFMSNNYPYITQKGVLFYIPTLEKLNFTSNVNMTVNGTFNPNLNPGLYNYSKATFFPMGLWTYGNENHMYYYAFGNMQIIQPNANSNSTRALFWTGANEGDCTKFVMYQLDISDINPLNVNPYKNPWRFDEFDAFGYGNTFGFIPPSLNYYASYHWTLGDTPWYLIYGGVKCYSIEQENSMYVMMQDYKPRYIKVNGTNVLDANSNGTLYQSFTWYVVSQTASNITDGLPTASFCEFSGVANIVYSLQSGDLWALDVSTVSTGFFGIWIKMKVNRFSYLSPKPNLRYYAQALTSSNKLVIHGGQVKNAFTNSISIKNDLWIIDLNTDPAIWKLAQWTKTFQQPYGHKLLNLEGELLMLLFADTEADSVWLLDIGNLSAWRPTTNSTLLTKNGFRPSFFGVVGQGLQFATYGGFMPQREFNYDPYFTTVSLRFGANITYPSFNKTKFYKPGWIPDDVTNQYSSSSSSRSVIVLPPATVEPAPAITLVNLTGAMAGVVIVLLAILGVAGFYGRRYYLKKRIVAPKNAGLLDIEEYKDWVEYMRESVKPPKIDEDLTVKEIEPVVDVTRGIDLD
jgi:hypothetical protein